MEQQSKLTDDNVKALAAMLLPSLITEMKKHFGQGYLKCNAACEYLGGISRNTLDKAVQLGQIKRYDIAGGTILFKKAELDSLPPLTILN